MPPSTITGVPGHSPVVVDLGRFPGPPGRSGSKIAGMVRFRGYSGRIHNILVIMNVSPARRRPRGPFTRIDRAKGPLGQNTERQTYSGPPAASAHSSANPSGSSDAPPTSAPSMSGCATSSFALFDFTDPP